MTIIRLLTSLLALAGVTRSKTSQAESGARAAAAQAALTAASRAPTSGRSTAH